MVRQTSSSQGGKESSDELGENPAKLSGDEADGVEEVLKESPQQGQTVALASAQAEDKLQGWTSPQVIPVP